MLLQLLPRDPLGRAAARMLTQRVSDEFVTAFKRVLIDQRDTKSVQVNSCMHLKRRVHTV
jgi:hypothetical protein